MSTKIFNNKLEIFFSDILKIETQRFVRRSKAENSTDGFHNSILILKNEKILEIPRTNSKIIMK